MVAFVRFATSLTSGDKLPSPLSDTSGADAVSVLLKRCSPCSSVVTRSFARDGNPAPMPQVKPFDTSTVTGSSGSPRQIAPAVPDDFDGAGELLADDEIQHRIQLARAGTRRRITGRQLEDAAHGDGHRLLAPFATSG